MIYEARSCFVPSRRRHQWLARLSPFGILFAVVIALLFFAGEVSAATKSESKSTAEIQSISPCDEEINPRWELFQNSMCDGQEHYFTLRKGETIVLVTDPYDDDAGGIEDSQEYDGTLSMCQEVFVMGYWGPQHVHRLQNEDIRVGRDSWLTWDPKDGSCILYSLTEDCQQLRSGAETEGMVSAHYCNFNS